MPRPGLIPARNHWCLHNDQLAQEFDGILNLTETFPGCIKGPGIPDGAIFYAPLIDSMEDVVGGEPFTVTRSLEALYLDRNGIWQIAAPNEPRFTQYGCLVEPATTNKLTVYNANPDAGLTGIIGNGATISRVAAAAKIAAAGLQNICTDGNVVRLTNGTGGTVYVQFAGATGNTTRHSLSTWIDTGGSDVYLRLTGGPALTVNTTALERAEYSTVTPGGAGDLLEIGLDPGVSCDVILYQLEEEVVVTTPIVTRGASASRNQDDPRWPGGHDLLLDSQGALSCVFTSGYTDPANQHASNRPIVNTGGATGQLYFGSTPMILTSFTGAASSSVSFPAGKPVYPERWGGVVSWIDSPANFFTSHKSPAGVWEHGTDRVYNGAWSPRNYLRIGLSVIAPIHVSSLAIFQEYRDRAWIEANL